MPDVSSYLWFLWPTAYSVAKQHRIAARRAVEWIVVLNPGWFLDMTYQTCSTWCKAPPPAWNGWHYIVSFCLMGKLMDSFITVQGGSSFGLPNIRSIGNFSSSHY